MVCEKKVWVGHIYTSVTTRESDDKWLSHWLGHVTGIYLKYQNPFTLKWAKLKYDITNQLVLTWDYLESFKGPRMSRTWEIENWLITENNFYVKSDACAEPSKCDFARRMLVR